MREILFRGKRIDNGEWVYGNLVRGCDEKYVYIVEFGNKELCRNYINVKPDTIGQYTALADKNGTKIFEGDIIYKPAEKITPYYATKSEHYKIIFRNGSFSYANLRGGTYWSIDDSEFGIDTESYTIIANIYDNPELIKEREQA